QLPKLVEDGHIYVARPPLYKVTQKKQVRYVQTFDEMDKELMKRGLALTKLTVFQEGRGGPKGTTAALEADRLGGLMQTLNELEKQLQILERRGITLSAYLPKSAEAKGLPTFRVLLGSTEHWFHSADEVDAFRKAEHDKHGKDLVVAD